MVVGIYGQKNEVKESYVSIIDKIDFGNTTLTKERVTAEEGFATLFGLSFFKNYRVILNWKTKKIKLIEQQKTSKENYKNFGFSYSFKNNSFFISSLFEGTQAKEKLKIGDKIMSINGKDYSFISNEKNCSIMGKGILGEFNESIKIEVLRGDKKKIFSIKKEVLL